MRVIRRVLCALLLVAVCLSSSGCFYQRLLNLKKQLKNFENYFVLEEKEDVVAMIFKKPVMLTADTDRFLGCKPTTILGEAPNTTYEYRMVKQYKPDQKEEGNFDYTYQAVMKDNKIERFVFDRRFFAATPRPMFVRACKMFGRAKVDIVKRSLTMGKVDSESYLDDSVFLNVEELHQLSGVPFTIDGNVHIYKYRLQQEGDESSWPEIVTMTTFTDEGEFMRGETTIMGGMTVERPLRMPTRPVPADGTTVNRESLKTLAWTGGYKTKVHRVYGGEDEHDLSLLGEVTDSTEFELPERDASAPYYWRVDAIDQAGTAHAGDVWHFLPGRLIGRWTFDETSGQTAHDVSTTKNHGTLQGDATFKPGEGILGGALALDGAGDGMQAGDLSLKAHQMTMTAWIKGQNTNNWANLIYFNNAFWSAGLYCCTGHHLHYSWYCDSLNSAGVAGPTIPKNEWTFIAAVVDYHRATMYVYSRSKGLKTKANKVTHQAQRISRFGMAGDGSEEDRRFTGLVDDVRVYDYALTRDEIKQLIKKRDPSPEP